MRVEAVDGPRERRDSLRRAATVAGALVIAPRWAFAGASVCLWVTLAQQAYYSNNLYLLAMLTALAALTPAAGSAGSTDATDSVDSAGAALLWSRRLVIPWALLLGGALHLGTVLAIGPDLSTTAGLVVFMLACGSAYPLFAARSRRIRPVRDGVSPQRPLTRPADQAGLRAE